MSNGIERNGDENLLNVINLRESKFRDYQVDCSDKVLFLLDSGIYNITAIMPPRSGISFVLKRVLERYLYKNPSKTILIITPNHESQSDLIRVLNYQGDSIQFEVLNDYEIKKEFNCSLVFFYNIIYPSQWSIIDSQAIETKTTVSFIISDDANIHHSYEEMDNFESNSYEIAYIDRHDNNIYKKVAYFVYSSHYCLSVRDLFFQDERKRELEAFTKLLKNNGPEQKCEVGSESDQIILGKEYQSFCENILSFKGYDMALLRKAFFRLKTCQTELLDLEDVADEGDNNSEITDQLLKKIQDTTTEVYESLLNSKTNDYVRKGYIDKLKEKLSMGVYNRLQPKSRIFIVTAMMMFDNVSRQEDKDEWDYSPICLEITKAVEVEVTKRFFTDYVSYCAKNKIRFPECLIKEINGKRELITESEFTLGKVSKIVGYKIEMLNDTRVVKLSDHANNEQFKRYAESRLYADKMKAPGFMKSDLLIIEKIRNDYRNPSAHKGRMNYVNAKECIDYVIDVQKKLKELLLHMKE